MKLQSSNPNFICIGPEKTGTTWLYHNLKEHPHVFLPPVKELRYFWERSFLPNNTVFHRFSGSHWHNVAFQKYVDHRIQVYRASKKKLLKLDQQMIRDLKWDVCYALFPRTENWYRYLFSASQGRVSGDITPLYYQLPPSQIRRISYSFPHLKIIILLRNPIDRAWSKAKMNLYKHRARTVDEVDSKEFKIRFEAEFSKLSSYVTLIQSWRASFPDKNVHVNFYDKLVEAPETFLFEICKFLELDILKFPDEVKTQLSTKINRGLEISVPSHHLGYLRQLYSSCISETAEYFKASKDEVYVKRWLSSLEA